MPQGLKSGVKVKVHMRGHSAVHIITVYIKGCTAKFGKRAKTNSPEIHIIRIRWIFTNNASVSKITKKSFKVKGYLGFCCPPASENTVTIAVFINIFLGTASAISHLLVKFYSEIYRCRCRAVTRVGCDAD